MINDPHWWMEVATWLVIEAVVFGLVGEFVVRPRILQARRRERRRRRRRPR